MHISAQLALIVWVPIGICFFYRYPVRVAILLNFFAGWALLPTANYLPNPAPFPYWILGACLPGAHFVTKATITGLAALAGVLLFDFRGLRRFRPALWDLPMAVWCLVPLLSGIANYGELRAGLRGALYQLLAWGVPYLLGRTYFAEDSALLLAAKAFVIGGLLYVPICLLEFFTGPRLYSHIYGYQPYQWLGAERYIGFRPVGFLEDGNQLGIWMATSALLAAYLWRHTPLRRLLGLPMFWVAIVLFAVTLLCQSGGSILLLLCLLPFALVRGSRLQRGYVMLLAVAVFCFAGLRLTNAVSLRALVNRDGSAHAVEGFMAKIGRESFGWRLEQDERHVKTALAEPWLGSGRWNWWDTGRDRPWGLWLLAFGTYGIVGLAALQTLQFAPAIRAAWFRTPARGNLPDTSEASIDLRHALAAAILISAIDNLLNSCMILPLVIVIGGLSTRSAGIVHANTKPDEQILVEPGPPAEEMRH
jgi:hypothetical protein